jgi:RNA polymerase sigma factor (sigma-70 family)
MSSFTWAAGLRHLRSQLAAQQHSGDSDEQLLHDFTTRRDDSAFAVLIRRHGPMVLHVCRRVLGHEQDAEDAFQATFLVLAQNAAALRNKTALASWLHGTAYRIAMKAKQSAIRRRKHEKQSGTAVTATPHAPANPSEELLWCEVRALLDEEIARLPEIYRSVFVLCCLENLSQTEAGQRLGVKVRTVSNRLAEARKRLAQRLRRRGVELTAVLAATTLATAPVSALPIGLMSSTIKAALAVSAGEKLAGIVSASVAQLVKSARTAMVASKAKIAVVLLLTASMMAGASAWAYRGLAVNAFTPSTQPAKPPAAKADSKPPNTSPKPGTTKTVEVQGRVLAPDGKPRAGAKLVLLGQDGASQVGVSAADGRFALIVPKETKGEWPLALLAQSRDAGLDFISLPGEDAANPIELRLVKDQAIRGRVVNTEGKPVAGVRVSISSIDVFANNSLESLLVRSQKNPADFVLPPGEKTLLLPPASLLDAFTDAEGRFVISGVGADRVAEVYLREGGIAKTRLRLVNHDGFDPKPLNPLPFDTFGSPPKMRNAPPAPKVLGPNLSVVAEPEKPIHGVVKDDDTGKGVPNVVVRLEQREDAGHPFVRTKTDAQGRFEFRGAHKANTYSLYVDSDSSTGYIPTRIDAADTVGYSPVNVDVRIKKGVIVTGKIIDKATGKAVPGFAQFSVLVNNPFAKDYPGLTDQRESTAEDGTFRVVVIPGPVLLMGGYYPPSTKYNRGPVVLLGGSYPPSSANFDYIEVCKYHDPVADPEYPQYFSKRLGGRSDVVGYYAYRGGVGGIQGNYCKVLDIKPGTAVVHQDMLLQRASVLEVKLQDTDGGPVEGVWATDFATLPIVLPVWIDRSSCPVYSLEQRKPRLLTFYEPKKKIIGSRRLQGDEKGPVVVKLGPTGAIKGRLLDTDGKPMAGALVGVMYREMSAGQIHQHIHRTKQVATDAAGSFTVDELIPELMFELSAYRGKRRFEREAKTPKSAIQVKPGECRDLGETRMKTQQ